MKILLVQLEGCPPDDLAADLRDTGYDVLVVEDDGPTVEERAAAFGPHVLVVRLDARPSQALDLAARLAPADSPAAASVLFTGGSEFALTAAQRRFPAASFARIDSVHTALASLDG